MFYIQKTSCASAQQTFTNLNIDQLHEAADNKLRVIEPSYEGIPTGILRRMGKAIRMGTGTALPIIKSTNTPVNGIIIGTADGGMEDCIKFLNQIIEYDEGLLTPTNFVQSTTNAIAAQIGLLSSNKQYNTTHVHRGLAFENALLDASMLLNENKEAQYLVGGVDEISSYNYNIDYLNGWFKKEPIAAADLYNSTTEASIAGEGGAMFLVSNQPQHALAAIAGLHFLHTRDHATVNSQLQLFLQQHLRPGEKIDLLLSGENGDSRLLDYYLNCENLLNQQATIARFKHMMGEYATCSAAALWLACTIIQQQRIPQHMIKFDAGTNPINRILIYNTFKGIQHSFILVERPPSNPA